MSYWKRTTLTDGVDDVNISLGRLNVQAYPATIFEESFTTLNMNYNKWTVDTVNNGTLEKAQPAPGKAATPSPQGHTPADSSYPGQWPQAGTPQRNGRT